MSCGALRRLFITHENRCKSRALIVRHGDTRRRRKLTDRRKPEKKTSFIAVTMSRFQLKWSLRQFYTDARSPKQAASGLC
jgi:hypothetical protein